MQILRIEQNDYDSVLALNEESVPHVNLIGTHKNCTLAHLNRQQVRCIMLAKVYLLLIVGVRFQHITTVIVHHTIAK